MNPRLNDQPVALATSTTAIVDYDAQGMLVSLRQPGECATLEALTQQPLAPIAQWIEHRPPEPGAGVRVALGAPH